MSNLLTNLQEFDRLNFLNRAEWPRLTVNQGDGLQLHKGFNPTTLRPLPAWFGYYSRSQLIFLTRYFGRVKPLYPCPQDTTKTTCKEGRGLEEVIAKATDPPISSP